MAIFHCIAGDSDDDSSSGGESGGSKTFFNRRRTLKLPAVSNRAAAQVSRVTEVRLVNTAYGPAKLQEGGSDKHFLIMRRLPVEGFFVPYVDKGRIGGVYAIAPDRAMEVSPEVLRYPILDVVPSFFLESSSREEVVSQLRAAGLELAFPAEVDLTTQVKGELLASEVTWRHAEAAAFDLATFVATVTSVKASDQFDKLYLISTDDGGRYAMAIDRLIETVIDLHPFFVRLYQPSAVRLRFRDSDNTWIARFGKGRA